MTASPRRAFLLLALLPVIVLCGCAASTPEPADVGPSFPTLSGPYLGEEPPGTTPKPFAPGVVTTNTGEWSTAFTPDGRELFFGLTSNDKQFILHMIERDGVWTEPVVASFSGEYADLDLTMAPSGDRLYFTSDRPITPGGPQSENTDLWYVDRTADGWGEPVRLPEPLSTADARELYPSESEDGYLYFFSGREGGYGKSDIYRAAILADGYGPVENLGQGPNTAASEGDPCISPKGDYIVFASRREGSLGDGDLWVSFNLGDGKWTEAVNLGPEVNTEELEFCPFITRDGQYLFFTTRRPKTFEMPDYRKTVRDELGARPHEDRGDIDIYWVSTEVIERLRPQ